MNEEHKQKISELVKTAWAEGRMKYYPNNGNFKIGHKIHLGETRSKETREKISETLKRKFKSGEIIQPFKGKKLSKEHIKNMTEGHTYYSKEKHPGWKGGKIGYYHLQAHKIVKKLTDIKIKHPLAVHHLDGDYKNNSSDNLMVCTRGYHTWLHHEMNRKGYGR